MCGGNGNGEQGKRDNQKRSENKRSRKTEKGGKNVVRRETRFSAIAYIIARQGW